MAPSRAPPAAVAATSPSLHPEDDDPVTAEYDVYITPRILASLYLLQFPTRDREQPYNAEFANAPSEMRIKLDSGFLEMDVPVNPELYYDKEKAVAWGAALAKSKSEGAQGHGLAAGFAHVPGMRSTGSGVAAGGGRGRGGGGRQQQMDVEEDESRNEHHKMRVQTLGGQIIKDEKGRPNYMIGAFRGTELHLTPITGLIQMRPQFHHIDAKTQQDRTRARRDREALSSQDPSSTTTASAAAQPRIVQMVNKSGGDGTDNLDGSGGGGGGDADTTKEYLNKAMEEQWTRLRFFDEEEDKAYEAYHACLFHNETERAGRLVAGMGNEAFVDAISAPRLEPSGKRVVRPVFKRGRGKVKGKGKGKERAGVDGVGGVEGEGGMGDTAEEEEEEEEEDEHEEDEEDEEEEEEEEDDGDDGANVADGNLMEVDGAGT